MVDIGSRYEEKKSMLVERVRSFDVVPFPVRPADRGKLSCYVCCKPIHEGPAYFVIEEHEKGSDVYVVGRRCREQILQGNVTTD